MHNFKDLDSSYTSNKEKSYNMILNLAFPNSDSTHYKSEIKPCVSFYKYLAPLSSLKFSKTSRLHLNIPDTIVYNDKNDPYWLYTGKDGYVYRFTNQNLWI